MAVFGGIQFFLGPAVGAIAYVLLETIITGLTHYWPMIMGVILIFLVMLLPNGLVSLLDKFRKSGRTSIVSK
jgi:branched-chain amino acid transport system permease protein